MICSVQLEQVHMCLHGNKTVLIKLEKQMIQSLSSTVLGFH